MPNLYGDILSDVAAQIAGSVGLAGSANIGEHCAMFEAIHGSAPRRAGQDLANPSGLLLGGVMMLVHIGQPEVAERVHNAWLRTIEDGIHTYDIFDETGQQAEGRHRAASPSAVIDRLGQRPDHLKAVSYDAAPAAASAAETADGADAPPPGAPKKKLVGVDVFLDWTGGSPDDLGRSAGAAGRAGPGAEDDHQPRREGLAEGPARDLLHRSLALPLPGRRRTAPRSTTARSSSCSAGSTAAGLDFIKTENLCTFDGEPGFSLGQGQ